MTTESRGSWIHDHSAKRTQGSSVAGVSGRQQVGTSHPPSPAELLGERFSLPGAPGEVNRDSSDSTMAAGFDLTSGQPTHR